MDKSRVELKVGIFVFVALLILGVFIFQLGNLKTYGSSYPIRLIFGNVSGVKPGSPVRFTGVDVGEVHEVYIIKNEQNKETQIEIVAWISHSLSIPQGSQVFVNTLGLLGEKYIEIIPPAEIEAFLQPGDALIGTDPIMLHHWIDEGEKILMDFQEIIHKMKSEEGTIGKLLSDDKLYLELQGLISDIRQAKQGTVGRLLYDDKLYQELEALISDLRRNPWKLFWKTKEKR